MTAYTSQHWAHRPMGLPSRAGCDTAWSQTRVSVVTPLALRCSALDHRHSGSHSKLWCPYCFVQSEYADIIVFAP